MLQSTALPLTLATLICIDLHKTLEVVASPCQQLHQQLTERLAAFFTQPPTPQAAHNLETDLQRLVTECARRILEAAFNHVEADNPVDAPKHSQRQGQDYCRKNQKSPNRGGIASLFGIIQLQRCLYEPLQEARDQGEKAFSPLERNLGIIAHNATPALAERVGLLAAGHTEQELLAVLKRDCHIPWGVTVLRSVSRAVSAGLDGYWLAAVKRRVLDWLAQASNSRGSHRFVLSVGRDGIMLPIRGEKKSKEGAVATISVSDRRGRRLGTVYLGSMPEAQQVTLSQTLTTLLQDILKEWQGVLPRLVYVTDAGYHPTAYYEEVLQVMEHPRQVGVRLQWLWVVDDYHASSYVSKLAELLFAEPTAGQAWARRGGLLLEKQGVFGVLHSAAYYHTQKALSVQEEKAYQEAYGYLLRHKGSMSYAAYRRCGLPIGSGVTEAGCKIVFTQRFKQSGMKWSQEGGAVILCLRLAKLSGVYEEAYEQFLANLPLAHMGTRYHQHDQQEQNVA